jgi:hypothetical protein
MSTDLVKQEPALPVAENVVVLARDPQEMVDAQQGLITWMDRKIAGLRQELAEAEENLATAKRMKHRTDGWQRQVRLAQGRITFYEKAKSALEEGYCIIPDFPVQLIAVKTSKRRPPLKWHSGRGHNVPNIESQPLPEGEGEYVSPDPLVREVPLPIREGEHHHRYESQASEFGKVDFPLKVVKPQILKGMEVALKRKLFDEIGILPQTGRGRDPVLVGRIKRREGSYNEPTLNFLIAWWIDTRDL